MRLVSASIAAVLGAISFASPVNAATIVVFTHPETFEQRTVVVDPKGPDRLFMCMLPPGEAGCHQVPVRRRG